MRRLCTGLLMTAVLSAADTVAAQSLSYAASAVDAGEPSELAFAFSTLIAPVTGLATYSFSGRLAMTDATGDGVSASPSSFPEYWRLSVFTGTSTVLTIDLGGTSTLTGAGPFEFATSGVIDCAAVLSCTLLQLSFSAQASGFGDRYDSEATFIVTPASVPEPKPLSLLATALIGLLVVAARRRAPTA